MLPGTPTTATVYGTTRFHSTRTGLEEFHHFGSGKPAALIHYPRPHTISRSREGYEDRKPTLGARDTITLG